MRENTTASLAYAANHGADFVEFDVQLTKDKIPVIFHDFYITLATKNKPIHTEDNTITLPLKDLELKQLQKLKIHGDHEDDVFGEDGDNQPFPRLDHVLKVIDDHVGFNVEVKWTMKLQDGSYELYHPFDINEYLDIVLRVVLDHAHNRKIVFSCFHPDICTMIRLKQNKFPVLFLTQGITSKYDAYSDPRTLSIPMAVYFAESIEILGINVHTEDILRDPSQIKLAQEKGLVVFCWGEDNNNIHTIKYLKELGLHGIIYDRIDQYGNKEVKESIFLAEAREMKVALKCIASASSNANTNS